MGISQTPYHNGHIPLLYSTVTGFVPSSCLFATHTLKVQLDMRLRRPPSSRYQKPHRSLTLLVQYAELHRSPGPRVSSAGPTSPVDSESLSNQAAKCEKWPGNSTTYPPRGFPTSVSAPTSSLSVTSHVWAWYCSRAPVASAGPSQSKRVIDLSPFRNMSRSLNVALSW